MTPPHQGVGPIQRFAEFGVRRHAHDLRERRRDVLRASGALFGESAWRFDAPMTALQGTPAPANSAESQGVQGSRLGHAAPAPEVTGPNIGVRPNSPRSARGPSPSLGRGRRVGSPEPVPSPVPMP